MILVDTSIWVDVLRDRTGVRAEALRRLTDAEPLALSRFSQFELLLGAGSEERWARLASYLDAQVYLELSFGGLAAAARIVFDLARQGHSLASRIDAAIAQVALENRVLLLHRDRDFDTIALVRPLRHRHVAWPGEEVHEVDAG